jgi:hypothetical protein
MRIEISYYLCHSTHDVPCIVFLRLSPTHCFDIGRLVIPLDKWEDFRRQCSGVVFCRNWGV